MAPLSGDLPPGGLAPGTPPPIARRVPSALYLPFPADGPRKGMPTGPLGRLLRHRSHGPTGERRGSARHQSRGQPGRRIAGVLPYLTATFRSGSGDCRDGATGPGPVGRRIGPVMQGTCHESWARNLPTSQSMRPARGETFRPVGFRGRGRGPGRNPPAGRSVGVTGDHSFGGECYGYVG